MLALQVTQEVAEFEQVAQDESQASHVLAAANFPEGHFVRQELPSSKREPEQVVQFVEETEQVAQSE